MGLFSLGDMYSTGGWVMLPLLLCSLAALTVIVYRTIWGPKPKLIAPKEVFEQVRDCLETSNIEQAIGVCTTSNSTQAEIFHELLKHADMPHEELTRRAELKGKEVARRLNSYLPILSTVASVAPLLGLLGTVIGMIHTFAVIRAEGVGNAEALSGGISEALLTTATGLVIAIPCLVFFRYFRAQAENTLSILELRTSEVCHLISNQHNSEDLRKVG
jgi:biopolymer transport protein ExbB